jgi:hypothetical protein
MAKLAHCAFCWHAADYGPGGDGVRLVVRRDDEHAFEQELFAHVFCLAGRLHRGVPLELDLFGKDWAERQRKPPA